MSQGIGFSNPDFAKSHGFCTPVKGMLHVSRRAVSLELSITIHQTRLRHNAERAFPS